MVCAHWDMFIISILSYRLLATCTVTLILPADTFFWEHGKIFQCLTPEKDVHSFKYFLFQMCTRNRIVVCSCMYAFCIEMRLNGLGCVKKRIFHSNPYTTTNQCTHSLSVQYKMHICMSNRFWCTHLEPEVPE